MSRKSYHLAIRRWHRRIGIAAAPFVLLLVVTGILLNHSHELGFDQQPLQASFWLQVYEAPIPPLAQGFPVGQHWLSSQGGKLYFDGQWLADCNRLLGVAEKAGQILAVCPDLLLLLTQDGHVIDQTDTLRGAPSGLFAVGRRGGTVIVHGNQHSYAVDFNDLSLHRIDSTDRFPAEEFVKPAALPSFLQRPAVVPELTREHVLQDLHSGRILGAWGPWLVDIVALLCALLAASGLILAASSPSATKRDRHDS